MSSHNLAIGVICYIISIFIFWRVSATDPIDQDNVTMVKSLIKAADTQLKHSSKSPDPIKLTCENIDDWVCSICNVMVPNVVNLPCLHQTVCSRCSTLVEKCPICRSPIDSCLVTFL